MKLQQEIFDKYTASTLSRLSIQRLTKKEKVTDWVINYHPDYWFGAEVYF